MALRNASLPSAAKRDTWLTKHLALLEFRAERCLQAIKQLLSCDWGKENSDKTQACSDAL